MTADSSLWTAGSTLTVDTTNPGPLGRLLFAGQGEAHVGLGGHGLGEVSGAWWGSEIPNPKEFWIVGCVGYMDQFKESHWTRFCMHALTTEKPQLDYCSRYNDTDETGRLPVPDPSAKQQTKQS
jgi:hypothetical protein